MKKRKLIESLTYIILFVAALVIVWTLPLAAELMATSLMICWVALFGSMNEKMEKIDKMLDDIHELQKDEEDN